MSSLDAVALTRDLLQFDTINPPGLERGCAHRAGRLLEDWGFSVEFHEYEKDRTSVVARAGGSDKKAPLCLTGRLDVVPLGTRKWSKDPFAGEADGDRLYGRGSSDMKARDRNFLPVRAAQCGRLRPDPAARRRVAATIGHTFDAKVLAQGVLWQILRPFGAIRQIREIH